MDFALPAVKTCPYAGECKKYCYAAKGAYIWPIVRAKHEANYQATRRDDFVDVMFDEIVMSQSEAVRIHSSGDFYNNEYFWKWTKLAHSLPHIIFMLTRKVYLLSGIMRGSLTYLVTWF